MSTLTHDIVDCDGFTVITRLPWTPADKWGITICRSPAAQTSSDGLTAHPYYGALGPMAGEKAPPALAVPLPKAGTLALALAHFLLACGLSVIARMPLDLGDQVVVTGANPLALSVLAAARLQGTRTLCLLHTDHEPDEAVRAYLGPVLHYNALQAFEAGLDAFVAAGRGKTVFVDTLGDPELVFAMAQRLTRFEYLVFCRQDTAASITLNIRQLHHLKSARFVYWSRPETLPSALQFADYARRAQRLFACERVTPFVAPADAPVTVKDLVST